MDLSVIYEDNHLLVVKKPYGVLSQSDITGDDDMLSLCKAYVKKKYNKPGDVYLGLVHRLDRPTGGVMVFARTSKAAARLAKQIQFGKFEKSYMAVLTARPREDKAKLVHYLLKDENERIAKVVNTENKGAKRAELEYEVLDEKDGLTLVSVRLLTGRFHQIRAQFNEIGCSVYGDMKYGKRDVKDKLALFACEVCLEHPTRKKNMCFNAEPKQYPFSLFDAQKHYSK